MKKITMNNREGLLSLMDDDAAQERRFAVRFIAAELSDWRWLLAVLADRTKMIYISKLCSQDKLPDLNKLSNQIKNYKQSISVIGVGELLRLYRTERIHAFVAFLQCLENGSRQIRNRRVYVPMLARGNSLLASYSTTFRSQLEDEGAIFWTLCPAQSSIPLLLSIVPQGLPVNGTTYNGLQAWVETVEADSPPMQSTLCTKTIPYINPQSDGVMQVEVIPSAYAILKKLWRNLPEEKLGSDAQWLLLAQAASKRSDSTFEGALASMLPRLATNYYEILEQWRELLPNQRWAGWLLLRSWGEGYLARSVRACRDSDDLINCAICTIFDYALQDLPAIHKQRSKILSCLNVKQLPGVFWQRLEAFPANQRFAYLSYDTEEERCYAIRLIRELKLTLHQIYSREDFRIRFPALHAYAAPARYNDPWLNDYFDAIRLSKLYNEIQPSVNEAILQWPSRHLQYPMRYDMLMNNGAMTVCVHYRDAVSAEWLPMLTQLIMLIEPDIDVTGREVRVNLPSITERNKPEGFYHEMFDDKRLDELQHKNLEYPLFLVRQLELIKEYAKDAADAVTKGQGVVLLTADHGSSRAAILNHGQTECLPEGCHPYYLGRYAVSQHPVNGAGWYVEDEYLVRLDHRRFSSSGPYGCENHGGATPEEELVPFLRLQKAAVCLLKWQKDLLIKDRSPVQWNIELDRQVDDAEAVVLGRKIIGDIINGVKVSFWLQGLSRGIHKVTLTFKTTDGSIVEKDVEIHVSGGIEDNDMGI